MPDASELMERMRKLREERKRAAQQNAAPQQQHEQQQQQTAVPSIASQPANVLPREEADTATAPLLMSVPPSFMSPPGAIPKYRDTSRDPLSAPFTAAIAARVLADALKSKSATVAGAGGQNRQHHRKRSREEKPRADIETEQWTEEATNAAVSPAVPFFLHYMRTHASFHTSLEPANPNPGEEAKKEDADVDAYYRRACAEAVVDVTGTARTRCRDVDRYLRQDFIAQGVYGVVFSATDAQTGRLYALKHIKRQWLEESQIGFPPYLLREIDLLLRVRHPNVVEARELVVLHPDPLPGEALDGGDRDTATALIMAAHPEGASSGPSAEKEADAQPRVAPPPQPSTLAMPLHRRSAKDVFLVMAHCPLDLKAYMVRYSATVPHQPYLHVSTRSRGCPEVERNFLSRVKAIAQQLFRGLAFLHAHRILHRDVKASNVLVDKTGIVKLCDLGLGRHYCEGRALTPTVVTLMYRAPELHFGVTDYSHTMDVWALGCVIAELFLKAPLFRAADERQHLLAVCDVLGVPTEEMFPGVFKLPRAKDALRAMGRWNRTERLAEVFRGGRSCNARSRDEGEGVQRSSPPCYDATLLPDSGLDLLRRIFAWNPADRPSAAEVVEHPFFHEDPLPCGPMELTRPMPAPREERTSSGGGEASHHSTRATASGSHHVDGNDSFAAGCGVKRTGASVPPPLVHIVDGHRGSTGEGGQLATNANNRNHEPATTITTNETHTLALSASDTDGGEELSLLYSNAMSPLAASGAAGAGGVLESEDEAQKRARQLASRDEDG